LLNATRALVVAAFLVVAAPASGEDFTSCWTTTVVDPFTLEARPVTRCRIAGGDVVDYGSDSAVPATLYPAAGTDLTGDCWFLTSNTSNWVYLNLFVGGDAILGWDPDPAIPGGVAFATERIPRCTSEPNAWTDPSAAVWEYVMAYIHPPPIPDLNPVIGDGVTGMETFVGVPVPADHAGTLSAAGVSVDVEIEVNGVVVDWGDGMEETFPAAEDALSGYPEGIARHVYEIKTADGYPIAVSYDWTARWRTPGDVWQSLDVPNTTTAVDYPVAEIISVITD
jgi:hypothetical protein